MLTVTHGRRTTRVHILAYTIAVAGVALALALTEVGGPITITIAVVLNSMFLLGAVRIWKRDDAAAEADNYLAERRFFKLSLYYLFLHFAALLADAALRGVMA